MLLYTDQEIDYLEKEFRLYIGSDLSEERAIPGEPVWVPATVLQNPVELRNRITLYGEWISAKNKTAAASLFAKAYGRILVGGLYVWSVLGHGPDLSAANMELYMDTSGLRLRVKGTRDAGGLEEIRRRVPSAACEPELKRKAQREAFLTQLYQAHLQPLFHLLSGEFHVKPTALWENSLVYILHYYKLWMRDAASAAHTRLIRGDFDTITIEAPPEVFGVTSDNPFHIAGKEIPHPSKPGESLRVRQTCCLKYNTGIGKHCTVCPLITEAQRNHLFA